MEAPSSLSHLPLRCTLCTAQTSAYFHLYLESYHAQDRLSILTKTPLESASSRPTSSPHLLMGSTLSWGHRFQLLCSTSLDSSVSIALSSDGTQALRGTLLFPQGSLIVPLFPRSKHAATGYKSEGPQGTHPSIQPMAQIHKCCSTQSGGFHQYVANS